MESESISGEETSQPSGDVYEIPFLFCTKCGHDLNHPLYTISQHPILPVPLCVLCYEEIVEKNEEYVLEMQEKDEIHSSVSPPLQRIPVSPSQSLPNPYEDLCHWCFTEADTPLFLCDHSKPCGFQFCTNCITENLGEDCFHQIQQSDTWICFACAPYQPPLPQFLEAIQIGKENSRLEELKLKLQQVSGNDGNSSSSAVGGDDAGSHDAEKEKLELIAWVLTNIVEQIEESLKMLDESVLTEKENAIRKELMLTTTESIAQKSKNEMELYCKYWRRHIDILQREEAILFELIESFGYDPRDLPVYKLDVEQLETEQSFSERQAAEKADEALTKQQHLDDEKEEIEKEQSPDAIQAKRKPSNFVYEEEIVEEENPDLAKIEIESSVHPIVQKFINYEDVDEDLYPPSFEKVLPRSLLKALYYASSAESKELSVAFDIPSHIPIIMALAENDFPLSTNHWSFAETVHPSVRKALYYARSPVESAVLCQRYNLDSEFCRVTDFGETKNIYNLFVKEKVKKKDRIFRISEKDLNEAVETEEKKCEAETSFIEEKEIRRNKSHPLRSKKQTDIKSFLLIKSTEEDIDELKLRDEKKDAVNVSLKNQPRKRTPRKSSSSSNSGSTATKERVHESSAISQVTNLTSGENKEHSSEKIKTEEEVADKLLAREVKEEIIRFPSEQEPMVRLMEISGDTNSLTSDAKIHSNDEKQYDSPEELYFHHESPFKPTTINLIDLSMEDSDIEFVKSKWHSDDDKDGDYAGLSDEEEFLKPKASSAPNRMRLMKANTVPYASIFKKGNKSEKVRRIQIHRGPFSQETLQAKRLEKERRSKLLSFDYFVDDDKAITLNNLRPENEPAVNVSSNFTKQLKPHQIDGLRFIWTNVMGSIAEATKITKVAHGCVLAHCMGLGKTFTIIAFVVTMLTHPLIRGIEDPKDKKMKLKAANPIPGTPSKSSNEETSVFQPLDKNTENGNKSITTNNSSNGEKSNTNPLLSSPTAKMDTPELEVKRLIYRILIVAPKNTLQNWVDEFKKWTPEDLLEQFSLTLIDSKPGKSDKNVRKKKIQQWFDEGGILIIGYEMFRNMAGDDPTPYYTEEDKKDYQKYLLKPGADLIIADEAHTIKNAKSKLRKVLEQVETIRRIALTGSPLQNNLEEYWVMVNWVKRHFLYNLEEYRQIFINPIKNGSSKGASLSQVMQMKKRTHALYVKLTPIVHRRDNAELNAALNPKREFILSIKMTDFQKFLYKYYLSKLPSTGKTLFKAYQCLMRIWNHPCCSIYHYSDQIQKEEREREATGKKLAEQENGRSDKIELNEEGKEVKKEENKVFKSVPQRVRPAGSVIKTKANNRFTMDDFRNELKESYAYYLYCSSSSNKMMEIEEAAGKLEEKMLHRKEQQDINILREADAQLKEGSMEIDFQEPVHAEEVESGSEEARENGNDGNADGENTLSGSEEEDEEESDIGSFIVDDDYIEYVDSGCDTWSEHSEEEDEEEDEESFGNINIDDGDSFDLQPLSKKRKSTKSGNSSKVEAKRKKIRKSPSTEKKVKKKQSGGEKKKKSKPKKSASNETVDLTEDNSMISMEIEPGGENLDTSNDLSEAPNNEAAQIAGETPAPVNEEKEGGDRMSPEKITSEGLLDTLIEEETPEVLNHDWWKFKNELSELPNASSLINEVNLSNRELLEISNKMMVFLGLLAISIKNRDKMLVFSQSLYTLNVIESFLGMKNWGKVSGVIGEHESIHVHGCALSQWRLNEQYLRIDGSVSSRQKIIDEFNQKFRFKLMLISTKAGNMGINLQSANRVVIFDSSWNPVHDLQAIFRTYRFGQEKNVFVYRLYAAGSMEEKIHKNQVVKQSLSERVVDKKMPENHFTEAERAEFLAFADEEAEDKKKGKKEIEGKEGGGEADQSPDGRENEVIVDSEETRTKKLLDVIASGTKDEVLFELIERLGTRIFKSVEDHDSLLADKLEEHLNEEEQKLAMEEFEKEAEVHLRVAQAQSRPGPLSRPSGAALPPPPTSFNGAPVQLQSILSAQSSNSLNSNLDAHLAIDENRLKHLVSLLDQLLVPNPLPVIEKYSTSKSFPPDPIPTNIPNWHSSYDILLLILHAVFKKDTKLDLVTLLVNQYITRYKGIQCYDQKLYQQRLHDIRVSPRGYYATYMQNRYIEQRIEVLLMRLRQHYSYFREPSENN